MKEATTVGTSVKKRKQSPVMRPLQMLRLGGKDVECVSLRRSSVAATDGVLGRSSEALQMPGVQQLEQLEQVS